MRGEFVRLLEEEEGEGKEGEGKMMEDGRC